ncbi:MAG: type II toxin-antitoxin system VapC family toxin [Puniceicoccaceae bacterium]|nr:MAG: type II toxin-antitoxin system VapC family toxin [Puniceicoccaceae bacterium]
MVDTCFLIDYQREARAQRHGAVAAFLKVHAQARLQISAIAWGEFLTGFSDEAHPFIAFARDRLDLLELTADVAGVYRRQFRWLKASGNLIGANDLWIGCHALARGVPIVSRNHCDFERIPELVVQTY